jgi:hypothetical protein
MLTSSGKFVITGFRRQRRNLQGALSNWDNSLRSKRTASLTRECQRVVCGRPTMSHPEWFEVHGSNNRHIERDPDA